jgi:transcriptional regulator with XRE-family HTH domain
VELAARLTAIKKQYGLNNKDLAQLWGLSEETVKNYFRYKNPTKVPKLYLEKLADTYGINKEWLVKGVTNDKNLNIFTPHKEAQPRPGRATSPPNKDHFSTPEVTQFFDSEMQETSVISYYNGTLMSSPRDVFNQTVQPTYQMFIPEYQDCAYSFTIHGHDMTPTLAPGTIVLCKPVSNKSQIKYGSIYYVIVNEYHMFRRLLKSETDGMIVAAADNETLNKAGNRIYADMELPIADISILYLIKAHINRLET